MSKERYFIYLQSDHWIRFKENYYKKHPRICFQCGTNKNIQLHHITYVRMGRERDCDVTPLCDNCHNELHREEKRQREQYREERRLKKQQKYWMNKPCRVGIWC